MEGLSKVREVQEEILLSIIGKNRDTVYGKKMGFDKINSLSDFQSSVPISGYEDFEPFIKRIAAGEQGVLTSEEVLLLEPTSGSTGGSKLIPYTASLKEEFQRGINPWLYDLYKNYPSIHKGPAYWSISPFARKENEEPSKIPVGFDDDADYLGEESRYIKEIMAVPSAVRFVNSLENFRYITCVYLLMVDNLSFISVWSPTFLSLLLSYARNSYEKLVKDIYDGVLRLPRKEQYDESLLSRFSIKGMPERSRSLKKIFAEPNRNLWPRIWKNLKVISCWKDGASAFFADRLQDSFPGVVLQGKGLISTEAFVSLPFTRAGGAVPAYTSHFLEFVPVDGGCSRLIDEIKPGEKYRVVVTTGGGLYRYDMKDEIEVTGLYGNLPVIKFTGRYGICDLVGEKLNMGRVEKVVISAVSEAGLKPDFILFSPVIDDGNEKNVFYTLFLEFSTWPEPSEKCLKGLADVIEKSLLENFHYSCARQRGQLMGVRIYKIEKNGLDDWTNKLIREGQKSGDIKPSPVYSKPVDPHLFKGRFL